MGIFHPDKSLKNAVIHLVDFTQMNHPIRLTWFSLCFTQAQTLNTNSLTPQIQSITHPISNTPNSLIQCMNHSKTNSLTPQIQTITHLSSGTLPPVIHRMTHPSNCAPTPVIQLMTHPSNSAPTPLTQCVCRMQSENIYRNQPAFLRQAVLPLHKWTEAQRVDSDHFELTSLSSKFSGKGKIEMRPAL